MKLTNADILKFQNLYHKHFHDELSDEEARSELTLLVKQLSVIYQPITISELDKTLIQEYEREV